MVTETSLTSKISPFIIEPSNSSTSPEKMREIAQKINLVLSYLRKFRKNAQIH